MSHFGRFKIPPTAWEEMREMYVQQGMSLEAIAAKYGCSWGTVLAYLKRLNVAIRQSLWTTENNPMRRMQPVNKGKTKADNPKLARPGNSVRMKGQRAWNTGLTIHTDARVRVNNERRQKTVSATLKAKYAVGDMVPYWRGKHPPVASLKQRSDTMKKTIATSPERRPGFGSPRGKGGFREDLGHFCRSTWEANLCQILLYQEVKYDYEKTRFPLYKNEKLVGSYLPDFYIPSLDVYIEVKGWMQPTDREKLALFKSNYPLLKLVVLEQATYLSLMRLFSDVPNLEYAGEVKPATFTVVDPTRKVQLITALSPS